MWLLISSTPSFQPDSLPPMSGIDRWLLPPEAFCLRKKFPRCISFSCFCSILPNWRMSNAGDNDGSASHRILHGDCDRLFGVLAILDQSTPQGRANLEKLQTSLKRGDCCEDSCNSGSGLHAHHRHGTDGGFWVWSYPTGLLTWQSVQ